MARLLKPIDYRGAVINVEVGPTRLQVETRRKRGQSRVNPSIIQGLLDTGASVSAIDPFVVLALQLTPVGMADVHSPTSGDDLEGRLLYRLRLGHIEPEVGGVFDALTVVGCDPLAANGYLMLIGRDVLDRCEFLYDGPKGEFTLTF